MGKLAEQVVDADPEVLSKIETLLLSAKNEDMINLVHKLIRMVTKKVTTLSSSTAEGSIADPTEGSTAAAKSKASEEVSEHTDNVIT